MLDWQPIETAPKGRCVLGYFAEYVGSGGPPGIEMQTVYWTDKNGGGWLTLGNWRPVRQPTRWMPLPEPPNA